MSSSESNEITDLTRIFLEPANPTQRQYEALRAYFVERLPSAEVAHRFGYTPNSFRVLCHRFRQNPHRPFFLTPAHGPSAAPKKDRVREEVVALRKQNLSIYDISAALDRAGRPLSPPAVSQILQQEGFARLPRRRDDERPTRVRPEVAAVADVRALDLSPRRFRTKFGGLFLFLPALASLPFDALVTQAGLPGSQMIPAGCAVRALLALKLFDNARHLHVMPHVFDEGLALFAGSSRIDPAVYPTWMARWFDAVARLGLELGTSFDLDFHTIPFHGEDALVEKHYVSKRSRRQKGVLAFVAQDATTRLFCYANAQVRKDDQADEILRFVAFWKARTGRLPEELVFDSKLTTYANLNQLNKMEIPFITLRRRSAKMLEEIQSQSPSAWRRIELEGVRRIYKTPRILDTKVSLTHYEGLIRQLTVAELGHEQPTLLLTNQLRRSAAKLIGRYAQRMIIENGIADGIDFFHMDALSSVVAMKVTCDLQLTLMASSLYRLLAARLGNGYRTAKSRHLFRDFVDATAYVSLTETELCVQFQKRAHNPLLLAAGFAETNIPIPWLGGRRLRFVFG
jgi:hypothetical protein